MTQETGETRDAIIEDDNKQVEDILNANKNIREKYWIVVFAKPAKNHVEGKPVLVKIIKPYNVKPASQVGMVIGEVDNTKGTIDWEVNMPDVPFNYEGLPGTEYVSGGESVVETSTIPNAYISK